MSSGPSAPETTGQPRGVGEMFGDIAGRYDLMNRVMTAGMDLRWRRLATEAALAVPGPAARCLDIGTGTGDLALSLAARPGVQRVLGFDLAMPMIRLARRKRSPAREN